MLQFLIFKFNSNVSIFLWCLTYGPQAMDDNPWIISIRTNISSRNFQLPALSKLFNMFGFQARWVVTSQNCWYKCKYLGGRCSFRGESGYCCRKNHWNNGDCPIGAIQAVLSPNSHDCVSTKYAQIPSKNMQCSIKLIFFSPRKILSSLDIHFNKLFFAYSVWRPNYAVSQWRWESNNSQIF